MKQKMNEANNEILDELPVNDMSYDLIDQQGACWMKCFNAIIRAYVVDSTSILL